MGIKGLTKLLGDNAPDCSKEQKFENYFGRKIAIDASMHIYQFLVVVGRTGEQSLTSEAGEVTSHLQGMFFRTARMLENGIKPVYVFDGKPPNLKKDELAKRFTKRTDATDDLAEARETGEAADVEKYSKRTIRVTQVHNDECKKLLRLMGVPVVEAPSEAEAQCCAMNKADLVFGVATEDMDALTFGTPRLIRNLMAPASAKITVTEYDYDKVLEGLGLTVDQFIDMCILCGCDYCGHIKGVGEKKALQLVQKFGDMKNIMGSLEGGKYVVPEPFPYEEARKLFKEPSVLTGDQLPKMTWNAPDEAGLVQFLVEEKSFSEDRIRKAIERIKASHGKSTQGRLESFFGQPKPKPAGEKRKQPAAANNKGAASSKGPATKKGKTGVGGKN
ncbi:hypothetical protein WJX74_006900 [Apatococcus lobatus]|uniref:Flap endonuclease 1 n=1 Tax=Apatococcus lobatus TaxID=904363 RepID=A0AAW1QBI6_9CHLO